MYSTSQISLILEYCARGNLRAYLIDHESEFMSSLKYYKENDFIEPLKISDVEDTPNDVFLLHRWSYQVNCVAFDNNRDVNIWALCIWTTLNDIPLDCQWNAIFGRKTHISW